MEIDFEQFDNLLKKDLEEIKYDYSGEIDFNFTKKIPVILIFVRINEKLILLKDKSENNYDIISGIYEKGTTLKKFLHEQLFDYLEVDKENILDIKFSKITENYDEKDKIKYIEYPILIDIHKDSILETFDEFEIFEFDKKELYDIDLRNKNIIKIYNSF